MRPPRFAYVGNRVELQIFFYRSVTHPRARVLTRKRQHLAAFLAFDQRHDLARDQLHDVFGLGFVAVPIINIGDAALAVIL